jgi:SET domain-containing protein
MPATTGTTDHLTTASRVEVRRSALGGFGVFATEKIPAGTTLIELAPVFDDLPGRHTIQVAESRHQAFTDDVDDYLNHSCRPTAHVDTVSLRVVALRDLEAGEEVTFNYLTTEWDMVEPFACLCDGEKRLIRGLRHARPEEREALAPWLPPWLLARAGGTDELRQ